ncbi:hypothetical protein ACHAXR_009076 [Thalassiosira sp. AJA248-18]
MMIQKQKFIAYAVMTTVVAILLSSTARIGRAILSEKSIAADFTVHLDDEDINLDDEPLLPINRRKLAISKGESGQEAVRDVLPALFQISSQTRKIDEKNLPYKCGVIMYNHHIPGEGGYALDKWIKELVDSNDNASFLSSESRDQSSKGSFIGEVEDQIQKVGPKDWKIIDTQRNGLVFATDENILRSWRDTVEKQNCHFIAASIFSDPLNHSIKYTKKQFAECKCSMPEFKEQIMEDITANPWTGQLDRFLFNSGNDDLMEMKEKVKRGMQLLEAHFDLVLVDGQGDFAEDILRITGWTATSQVKKANVSDGGLVYSKDMVSQFGKLSTKNGDADFIDAVNHVYHNSLGYLFDAVM